jgi:hypothetical protein
MEALEQEVFGCGQNTSSDALRGSSSNEGSKPGQVNNVYTNPEDGHAGSVKESDGRCAKASKLLCAGPNARYKERKANVL